MKAFRVEESDPRSMSERMIAGDWYIADDDEIQNAYRTALRTTARFNEAYAADPDAAQEILRPLLGSMGEGVHIRSGLQVDYGSRLFIGDGTFANYNLVALDVVDIRIGRNCQIATNVQLLTPIHPLEPGPRRDGWESAEPITIGDNVWLGGGVTVCPGVTIGDDCVVGAGSVVTRSLPPRSLAVGSPARVFREL